MNTNEFFDWLLGYLDASDNKVDTNKLKEKLKEVTKVYYYSYPYPAITPYKYPYPTNPYYVSNTTGSFTNPKSNDLTVSGSTSTENIRTVSADVDKLKWDQIHLGDVITNY